MTEYVEFDVNGSGRVIILSEDEIRKRYYEQRDNLRSKFVLFFILMFICPPVALYIAIDTAVEFYQSFLKEIFQNENKYAKYNKKFAPKISKEALSIIGYIIKENEVQQHLSILEDSDALKKKQEKYKQKSHEHLHFGWGLKKLVTHVALIGKTGSGKTEGVRALLSDTLSIGAAASLNDGKADIKMYYEMANDAKKKRRETSHYIINYLKPTNGAETNTISLFKLMHPLKLVNFLGDLIDKGGSSGQEKYFQERGKSMLLPIVQTLYVRDELKGEAITFEKIEQYSTIESLVQLQVILYCMCRDLNNIIKNKEDVQVYLNEITDKDNKDFQEIDKIIDYIIDNPSKRVEIESIIGIKYSTIREIYKNSYSVLSSYLRQVWASFNRYNSALEEITYLIAKDKGLVCFSLSFDEMCSIESIKKVYNEIAEIGKSQDTDELNKYLTENMLRSRLKDKTIRDWRQAFIAKEGTVIDPPSNAIQQHSYAQQQWTQLMQLFIKYNHVFGQSNAEIDPKQAMLDNKIIYTLLPTLESGADTEILGKIIIMILKEIAAVSLGGEKISIHKTLRNIIKDSVTPKPFALIFLDEYGAYPVPGLDLLLAQLRSLLYSVFVGIQDLASTKAGGNDITSLKRFIANTTKMILRIDDEDTLDYLSKYISKRMIYSYKQKVNHRGEIVKTPELEAKEVPVFKKEILQSADNGMCAIFGGSTEDDISLVQTFYQGGSDDTITIRRFKNFNAA